MESKCFHSTEQRWVARCCSLIVISCLVTLIKGNPIFAHTNFNTSCHIECAKYAYWHTEVLNWANRFFSPKLKLVRAAKEIKPNYSVKIQYLFNCHCSKLNTKTLKITFSIKSSQCKLQQSIPDYWGVLLSLLSATKSALWPSSTCWQHYKLAPLLTTIE